MPEPNDGPAGAYGLALSGVDAPDLLLDAAGWPSATVRRTVGDHAGQTELGDDAATIRLVGGGAVSLECRGALAHFVTPEPIGDAELIHPLLAPAAAVLNYWLGGSKLQVLPAQPVPPLLAAHRSRTVRPAVSHARATGTTSPACCNRRRA